MLVRCHHDPREFLELVEPFLASHEAENALSLGIARSFVDTATHDGLMFSVESGPDVVAVALKTPKRNLVITRAPEMAARALAQYLYAYAFPVPGINGPNETVAEFCKAWTALTDQTPTERMKLRLYQNTKCAEALPATPPGTFRVASATDCELVERWLHAFIDEATHDGHDHVRERVAQMVGANCVGLWDHDGPASMATITRRSGSGAHVSWVFTPKDRRGSGYATAIVAELTRRELANGRGYCTLYTDLANKTSNGIYERIGYKPVIDAVDVTFH